VTLPSVSVSLNNLDPQPFCFAASLLLISNCAGLTYPRTSAERSGDSSAFRQFGRNRLFVTCAQCPPSRALLTKKRSRQNVDSFFSPFRREIQIRDIAN
jgi:hypothetical protein